MNEKEKGEGDSSAERAKRDEGMEEKTNPLRAATTASASRGDLKLAKARPLNTPWSMW